MKSLAASAFIILYAMPVSAQDITIIEVAVTTEASKVYDITLECPANYRPIGMRVPPGRAVAQFAEIPHSNAVKTKFFDLAGNGGGITSTLVNLICQRH